MRKRRAGRTRRDLPVLGAHVSTAGGLPAAFDRAEAAGCECMQIFTKNKGAWAAPPLREETVRLFRSRARTSPVHPVAVHAAYLINLASPEKELRARSTDALAVELERCEALDIPWLVVHPGAHMGAGEAAGLRRVARSLDAVHRRTRGFSARVLLENAAGQGSAVCARFDALGKVLGLVREPERLGVCIDSCHAFAAGYEVRTDDGYAAMAAELDDRVGLDRVLLVHANDSRRELGSRVDRHEHIGRGLLGKPFFRRLLADRRFARVPMLFELPPENDMIRVNLRALRRLRGRSPGARTR